MVGRATHVAVLLALGAACSTGGGEGGGEVAEVERVGDPVALGTEEEVLVEASPQKTDGTFVIIDRVVMTGSEGYVVVYADGGGAPGRQLGASDLLEEGTTTDVRVELADRIEEDAVVHAMVHLEDSGDDSFGFPDEDAPATGVEGGIIEVPFQLTVDG